MKQKELIKKLNMTPRQKIQFEKEKLERKKKANADRNSKRLENRRKKRAARKARVDAKVKAPILNVYTDGSLHKLNRGDSSGFGGWGALIFGDGDDLNKIELCGDELDTTSNRMELTAAIKVLEYLEGFHHHVRIHTDSKYLMYLNGGVDKWYYKGWKTSQGADVLNRDLWEQLLNLKFIHRIECIKVKAHSGNKWNDYVDDLAYNCAYNLLKSETRETEYQYV